MSTSTNSQDETHVEDRSGVGANKKSKFSRSPFSCDFCKNDVCSIPWISPHRFKCDLGDSNISEDGRCSNCRRNGVECSHRELTKTLGSSKSYVERLETSISKLEADNELLQSRVGKLERLFKQLLPDLDLEGALQQDLPIGITVGSPTVVARNDDEDRMHSVDASMKYLTMTHSHKVFGKSSLMYLFHTAMYIKTAHDNAYGIKPAPYPKRIEAAMKRNELWRPGSWQTSSPPPPPPVYTFPEPDLLNDLIELYFLNINSYFPLLHRPTIHKGVSQGLHLSPSIDDTESRFAEVVLLVSALGARYSNDPRVFLNTPQGDLIEQSAGWKWYVQVKLDPRDTPSLGLVQMYALAVQYKPCVMQFHWNDLGFAIRLALDIGTHQRKKIFSPKMDHIPPTSQGELRKRAFWVLLLLDRDLGSYIGRPSSISEEDFDQDLPVECDDEYWDHPDPNKNFVQPRNAPSKMSYFISRLELSRIQMHVMRKVYFHKKPAAFRQRIRRSDQDIIAELDSALTTWLDSVPPHLRWDPHRIPGDSDELDIFRRQSVHLHIAYYQLQILLHRAFIPTPSVSSELSFPSLAICTSAARGCVQVAKAMLVPRMWLPIPQVHVALGTAAVILLLNGWSKRNYDQSEMGRRDLEHLGTVMKLLKAHELSDIMAGLPLNWGDDTGSGVMHAPSVKRQRDFDPDNAATAQETTTAPSMWPSSALMASFDGDTVFQPFTTFDDSAITEAETSKGGPSAMDTAHYEFMDPHGLQDFGEEYQADYGLFGSYMPDMPSMVDPAWPVSFNDGDWQAFIESFDQIGGREGV